MSYGAAMCPGVPIVTVSGSETGWSVVTWNSTNSGIRDKTVHTDKKVAETAAKEFAKRNNLIYVEPCTRFISIKPSPELYILVEVMPLEKNSIIEYEGKGNFTHAFNSAEAMASDKQLPFAPYWFLGTSLVTTRVRESI